MPFSAIKYKSVYRIMNSIDKRGGKRQFRREEKDTNSLDPCSIVEKSLFLLGVRKARGCFYS